MGYLIESGDGSRVELSVNLKKKYARAKRQFELGLWGVNCDCVYAVTLTTWSEAVMVAGDSAGESRNNWNQMVKDNRQLRFKMRKLGYDYEDSWCCEISPVNHLLHLHGFIKFNQPLKDIEFNGVKLSEASFRIALSETWEKVHRSKIVYVEPLWDSKHCVNYDVKHAVKNYISEGFNSMRILRSKGWLPSGWKIAVKAVTRWAMDKVDWLPEDGEEPVEEYFSHEYIWHKWEVAADYLRQWCEGKSVELDISGGVTIWLNGNEIIEGVIESDGEI